MIVILVGVAVLAAIGWALALVRTSRSRELEARLAGVRDHLETVDAHARGVEAASTRLTAALNQVPDAMVVVDRAGRVMFRNESAQRMATARSGEILIDDALTQLVLAALSGSAQADSLELFGPPSGAIELSAFPLRRDHEVVGAVAFARDVSEPRRVDQMRRDFVANVSHELKTPIGALALLAETLAGSDDVATVRQLSDQVLHEADRLARIVDDLLDLSALEAEKGQRRSEIGFGALLGECVDLVGAKSSAAGVPVEVGEVPDVTLLCDPRQLRSAIVNLLDNAINYSEKGQPVELHATVDDGLTIAVHDHGIGIPSRDLERVFERFYRVDRARSRDSGGTGLGLAIVRHVARAHGGEVTVESREGEGSVFTLQLPASCVAPAGKKR